MSGYNYYFLRNATNNDFFHNNFPSYILEISSYLSYLDIEGCNKIIKQDKKEESKHINIIVILMIKLKKKNY